MPDLLAGTEVLALDFTPSAGAYEDTLQQDVNGSSYVAPAQPCSVTFTAPSSGRVKLIVGGGIRDNTNNFRGFISPEVRETNVSGTVVLAPTVIGRGMSSQSGARDYMYHTRQTILEGLVPGRVYFARVMFGTDSTAGNHTVDFRVKHIEIIPVP